MDEPPSPRRSLVQVAAMAAFMLLAPHDARAGGRFSFIGENDILIGRDEHYTQGLKLGYARDVDGTGRIVTALDALFDLYNRGKTATSRRVTELSLGQSIFVPRDFLRQAPPATDRPYAGWLYASLSYHHDRDGRSLDSIELLAGQVGPHSRAEQAVEATHQITHSKEPRGWNTQIADRFGAMLSLERKWRGRCGWKAEITSSSSRRPGSRWATSLPMRAPGCSLASAIASAATTARRRSAPSLTGTAYDCFEQRARAGGWSLYAGFQGRLIRQQLFIEGRSDTSTSEVRKKPFVLDTLIGADWSPFDRWQVGLVMVSRTREFHGQRRVDYFSGLQIIRLIE